jgi:large subunit ribosomal protein L13
MLTIFEAVRIILVCRFLDSAERECMATGKTTAAAPARQWHIIDADGKVLGRVATAAVRLLQGKHKPSWVPYLDGGDHVVIINATRVKLTGQKEEQKLYRYHSGYEGGLREERAKIVRQKNAAAYRRRGDPRHAAENQARQRYVSQAQGLPNRRPSPRRPETPEARGRVTWLQRSITARAAARPLRLACFSGPERAPSPSTRNLLKPASRARPSG